MTRRMLLVIVAVIGWTLVYWHVSNMDERWFGRSLPAAKGLALYQLGQYAEAADAYREHLRQLAERTEIPDAAWAALLRGDLDTVFELSSAALVEDPEAVEPALDLVEIALARRDDAAAHDRLAQVLARDPDNVDALLLLATVHARSNRDDEAIAAFHRALRTGHIESRITVFLSVLRTAGELLEEPRETRSWCVLAQAFRYLRIFDPANGRTAIRYARRAIRAGDHPADAYLAIGVIHSKEGRPEQALAAFRYALEVDPQHAEASRWAATIYGEQGDLIKEYEMAKTAFDAAPHDPFYVRPLDYVLVEKLGDIRLATELFEEKRAMKPDNAKIHARLGYLYGFAGDHERSRGSYQDAIALEPDDPTLYEGLAFSLNELGSVNDAILAYEHAAALAPDRHEPHSGLAKVFYDQRKYDRARTEYETAFRLGDRDLTHLAELCALYHVSSMFDAADACIREVLRHDPRHTLALRLRAETDRNREQ